MCVRMCRMLPSAQVIQSVASGSRLPIPSDAPLVVRDLMARCFSADPGARPSMQQIADALEAVVEPAVLMVSIPATTADTSSSGSSGGSRKGWGRKKAARKKDKGERPLEEFTAPLMDTDTLKAVIEKL